MLYLFDLVKCGQQYKFRAWLTGGYAWCLWAGFGLIFDGFH